MSLVSNVFDTSSYKPKAKKKSRLDRFADTISAPFEAVSNVLGLPQVVETLARPAVETYAGVQQLRGKETSRWVKEHGLQTPETAALMDSRATDANLGALVKQKKAEGYKGAGFTDILNVASLAPGLGTFAKGTKALGSASKVASGAEKFLPTLGKTLKSTVPAGAGWGAAYGAAGAVDEGGNVGEGALIGGLTGAAVGVGLGGLGAGIGALANKASRIVNKDTRVKAVIERNRAGLTQIEDNNAPVRNALAKYKKRGVDAKELLAQTDLLVDAVDDTGTLRTTQEGGAVSQLQDFIKPQESVVSDILKREGKIVSLKDVEKSMVKNLDSSNITGADLIAARNKIKQEIAGLRIRADKEGNIPMWLVQDAKTYKYGNIDYMKPSSKNTDKLIARTFKEIIEQGTESADIRALNKELQAHYSVLGLLERLDGKKVQGGKLGKYFAQTVGSIVGSHFGPLGSIVGAEIGGRIRGAQMKSQFGKATGKGMGRSQVLLDAMDLAQKPKPTPELIPESRRLAAPAMTTPTADTSGLLSQEEARAKLRSYGVTVDDLAPQSSKSLGNRNTSQSKTMTPTSIGISKTIPETPKVDINSVDSLNAEITRRVEKFRSEAGIVAQREGAGVKMIVPDNGLETPNTEGFKKFSLNQAKGTMKAQADSAKKYANTMLYENDPEFRSLVDVRDTLLESRVVEAKTIPEVDEVFKIADTEELTIIKESEQYAQANPLDETPSTSPKDQGNGLGQEKGTAQGVDSTTAFLDKYHELSFAEQQKVFADLESKGRIRPIQDPLRPKQRERMNALAAESNKKSPGSPLLSEAKKYKTAEQFVSKQKKLFHGTNEQFEKFDISKSGDVQVSDWGDGIYFTDDANNAKNFAKVAGGDIVMERYAPDVKFADGSALLKDSDFMLALDDGMGFTSPAEYLSKKGYGGVKFENPRGFTEYVVFDADKILTQDELLDIYKKAHGK